MNYQSSTFRNDLTVMVGDIHCSRTTPRTIYGLRVAIAGLPPEMQVRRGPDVNLPVSSVQNLRDLADLSYRLEVLIPFRIQADSTITINRCYEP
jgi:hypothetical protein